MARILIVDDDEADRVVLNAILERAGHETFLAEDGKTALSTFGATQIDVIVTELQMPEMHGLELITVLREASPRPAIIALSGTGRDQLDMAQALGADEALMKPIDSGQLLGAISRALGGEASAGASPASSFRSAPRV